MRELLFIGAIADAQMKSKDEKDATGAASVTSRWHKTLLLKTMRRFSYWSHID